jgi:hypothetical protein
MRVTRSSETSVLTGLAGCQIPEDDVDQQYFPAAWKEAAFVPVFTRGSHVAMSNYRPISILKNLFKLFEFIIHDHVSH